MIRQILARIQSTYMVANVYIYIREPLLRYMTVNCSYVISDPVYFVIIRTKGRNEVKRQIFFFFVIRKLPLLFL